MIIKKARSRQIEEAIELYNKRRTTKYYIYEGDTLHWYLKGGFLDYEQITFGQNDWRQARIEMYNTPKGELKKAIMEMEKIMRIKVTIILKQTSEDKKMEINNEQENRESLYQKEYKRKMQEKMERLEMTPDEYHLFVLQGIKKELMTIRKLIQREIEEGEEYEQ